MASKAHSALTSSRFSGWRTPQYLFDALHEEFNFVLDAAAQAEDTKCGCWLGPDSAICDDALVMPWGDYMVMDLIPRGAIFCNPPYSRDEGMGLWKWLERIVEAAERVTVVGLFPYQTQTRWYREFVEGSLYKATEIRRFPYRLAFDPPVGQEGMETSSANVNQCVAIWKPSEKYLEPWAPLTRYWDIRPKKARKAEVEDE